ncbi:chemotaxis protein CheW [Natroniella sulfidigena]|uniref:chemotaxis protein CheW n=1 Tax=Natroniella sulfidigena TaxID=723921 RepID=UPI00200B5F26|nr:chemotaxis protein CheW [Natroniella sulfidigena]MCK8816819.1 chemotaxis protein CheW [Natroniella sulfidigena]
MSERSIREGNTLNILNQQLTNMSAENQYVTFKIGEEHYGINIMLVQEIIRYSKSTKVFNANPVIEGLINFRGNVIPIIDMHRKFNLPEIEYDKFTVIIVFEVADKMMGMIVDRVSDIMSFSQDDIQIVDQEFADDIKTEHLKGIAKVDQEIVLLLDPKRILSFEELEELGDFEEEAGFN